MTDNTKDFAIRETAARRFIAKIVKDNQSAGAIEHWIDSSITDSAGRDSFEKVLIHALCYGKNELEEVLQMIWIYLMHNEENRLSHLLNLKDTFYPDEAINFVAETSSSLLLLHALTHNGLFTSKPYLNLYYEKVSPDFDSRHFAEINGYKKICPDNAEELIRAFSGFKLSDKSCGQSTLPTSINEQAFIDNLFSDRRDLLAMHISFPFDEAFSGLHRCDYRLPLNQRWPRAKRLLDTALAVADLNIDDDNKDDFLKFIVTYLRRYHFNSSGTTMPAKQRMMGQLFFTHFVSSMDKVIPSWRPCLAKAMSDNQILKDPTVTEDELEAAAAVLENKQSTTHMITLACIAIKDKPLSVIAKAFSDKPEAMVTLYRRTHKRALLPLMSPAAKRLIISEDLDL